MELDKILEAFKDNPEAQTAIKAKFELADAAEKIKLANADLTKQREAWEAEKKAKPSASGNLADINALAEQLRTIQTELEKEKSEKAKALNESRQKDLKSSIIALASQGKAKKPDQIVKLLLADGLVGHKEDGTPYFHKLNEKGEPVSAKPEEVVNWYLGQNLHLVDGSGTQGSGSNTRGSGVGDSWKPEDNLSFKK